MDFELISAEDCLDERKIKLEKNLSHVELLEKETADKASAILTGNVKEGIEEALARIAVVDDESSETMEDVVTNLEELRVWDEYIDLDMEKELLERFLTLENDKVVFAVKNVDVMDYAVLTRYNKLALVVRKGKLQLVLYPKYGEEPRFEDSEAQNSTFYYDNFTLLQMRDQLFRTRHKSLEEASAFRYRFKTNTVDNFLELSPNQDWRELQEWMSDYGYHVSDEHLNAMRTLCMAYKDYEDSDSEEEEESEEEDEEEEDSGSGYGYREPTCKVKEMVEYLQYLGEVLPKIEEEAGRVRVETSLPTLLPQLSFNLRTLPEHGRHCECDEDHSSLEDREAEEGDGEKVLGWRSIALLLGKYVKDLERLVDVSVNYEQFKERIIRELLEDFGRTNVEEFAQAMEQCLSSDSHLSSAELHILQERFPALKSPNLAQKTQTCSSLLRQLLPST